MTSNIVNHHNSNIEQPKYRYKFSFFVMIGKNFSDFQQFLCQKCLNSVFELIFWKFFTSRILAFLVDQKQGNYYDFCHYFGSHYYDSLPYVIKKIFRSRVVKHFYQLNVPAIQAWTLTSINQFLLMTSSTKTRRVLVTVTGIWFVPKLNTRMRAT